MKLNTEDTIAAIATPPGSGGVGIVRVSGPDVETIATAILGKLTKPRNASYMPFFTKNDETIDEGLAIYFPAPHSFTGQSVLELQAHGGPVVLDRILGRVLELGARMANAGEFSLRAFVNDKMDLLQAEAIADLISAGSEQAARSAARSLQGEFSNQVNSLVAALTSLRVYVEASIDFVEEEIDFLAQGQVHEQTEELLHQVQKLLSTASQGALLQRGAALAIVGEPNVGKSSLLNRLTGEDSAIVTAVPGTTRDVLREQIQIDGLPIHLVDTAGLRDTQDIVEQAGIERSWREVAKADCLIFVWDLSTGYSKPEGAIWEAICTRLPKTIPVLLVGNKLDLCTETIVDNLPITSATVYLSAKSGSGIEQLREEIKQTVGYRQPLESTFIARRRHVTALQRAEQALQTSLQLCRAGDGVCLAEELRIAQQALGELTGAVSADDLLGKIFGQFCIGK